MWIVRVANRVEHEVGHRDGLEIGGRDGDQPDHQHDGHDYPDAAATDRHRHATDRHRHATDRHRHAADRLGDGATDGPEHQRHASVGRPPAGDVTVLPSGALGPRTVIAPPRIPVDLTVVSGDGRAHRALLRTPVPRTLSVPAHGRASVLVTGLKNGQYSLDIDGVPRGALVVGGAPGP